MPDFIKPQAVPRMFPHAAPGLITDFQGNVNKWLTDSGCRTKENALAFMANLCEESSGLTQLEENLNYSSKRLAAVWPRRFPTASSAEPYARDPEALANHVYANRMGNGNEASGDGYLFRGRGAIMWTGREGYTYLSRVLNAPSILSNPDVIKAEAMIGIGAFVYYRKARLEQCTDLTQMTIRINGGKTNIAQRNAYYQKYRGMNSLMDGEIDVEPNVALTGRISGYMADFSNL